MRFQKALEIINLALALFQIIDSNCFTKNILFLQVNVLAERDGQERHAQHLVHVEPTVQDVTQTATAEMEAFVLGLMARVDVLQDGKANYAVRNVLQVNMV